jgi:hypothetical protein
MGVAVGKFLQPHIYICTKRKCYVIFRYSCEHNYYMHRWVRDFLLD